MLDQRTSNSLSRLFGCLFLGIAVFMLFIGIALIFEKGRSYAEDTIMILSLLSGGLLLMAGVQNIRKARNKDEAMKLYKHDIRRQLSNPPDPATSALSGDVSSQTINETEEKPDVIARWSYTQQEWRAMNREENRRRLKEGIVVSLGVGLLGAWVLYNRRGLGFFPGFLIAVGVGIFVSLLKVALSNGLFATRKNNQIIFTSNALFINGKFKTIQDDQIGLQYVRSLKTEGVSFLEFSLQWQTRGGLTNDQFRILVPSLHEHEIQTVLNYYRNKGVEIRE